MNQIAVNSSAAVSRTEPKVSPNLGYQIDLVRHPHPDAGAPKQFTAAVKAEARAAADAMAPLCAPVTMEALREWIRPIGAAVRNPPSQEDFAAWGAALVIACDDFAIGAFTATTQREALQTFQFWPSVADICGIVGGRSIALRGKLSALRRIADGETLGAQPERSEEEAAAVRAKFIQLRADLKRDAQIAAPIKPSYGTPEQLAEGRRSLAERAAALSGGSGA